MPSINKVKSKQTVKIIHARPGNNFQNGPKIWKSPLKNILENMMRDQCVCFIVILILKSRINVVKKRQNKCTVLKLMFIEFVYGILMLKQLKRSIKKFGCTSKLMFLHFKIEFLHIELYFTAL